MQHITFSTNANKDNDYNGHVQCLNEQLNSKDQHSTEKNYADSLECFFKNISNLGRREAAIFHLVTF